MKLHQRIAAVYELPLSGTATAVMVCLAFRADEATLISFPGAPRIARDTGFSESTVREQLRILESLGQIEKVRVSDGRHANSWRLNLAQPTGSRQVGDVQQTPEAGSQPVDSRQVHDEPNLSGAVAQPIGSRRATYQEPSHNSNRTVLEQIPPPAGANGAASPGMRWKEGIATLTAAGTTERSARSLVAMLCKRHGDLAVEGAVERMVAVGPADPSAWLIAAVGAAKRDDPAARYRAEAEAIERRLGINAPEEF